MYFPLTEYWWLYLSFVVFVLAILALDLGVFHKKAHEVSVKEAAIWSGVWVFLALVFNYLFYIFALYKFQGDPNFFQTFGVLPADAARQSALEFLAGYVIEKSLAIDNIFVFVVVFSYFAIPRVYQHRILFWGILGALVFRAIFVALGSALMQYHAVIIIFGVFLIFTGIKLLFAGEEKKDLSDNVIMKILKKFFKVTDKIDGEKFFITENGVRYVTPLFVALFFIELTDIVFAVDSVPAIFALTKEPLIVFTSNIFAILGLRSMYFMFSGVMDKFTYIKYGLAAVLCFVGLKMIYLNQAFDGKFPITWSLAVITGCIGLSILASVIFPPKDKKPT